MKYCFVTGNFRIVDEIMNFWKGLELHNAVGDRPHVTEITRKPKGVGAECNAVACGESRLLFTVKPKEGENVMTEKQFQRQYGACFAIQAIFDGNW